MKIEKLEIADHQDKCRLVAEVSYESINRPVQEIYFEVENANRDYLRDIYEPFLLACFPAALVHKEERIAVDGRVCSELLDNVKAAMLLQRKWWNDKCAIPNLEVRGTKTHTTTSSETSSFMSGGVDSLSNFFRNISLYRKDDPRRIRHAVFVYGLDIGDPNKEAREDVFEQGVARLEPLLRDEGCALVPVYTNSRNVEADWHFYEERHFGALLGGIAHALSGRFGQSQIALDLRVDHCDEWGSHPWLNKYLSSTAVGVVSTMDSFSRVEKVQFIGRYPRALSALRVCHTMHKIGAGELNCGVCSKCTRTKIELLSSGLLEGAVTFRNKEIRMASVKQLRANHLHDLEFLEGPIEGLVNRGEHEIADYLRSEVARYRRFGFIQSGVVRMARKARDGLKRVRVSFD